MDQLRGFLLGKAFRAALTAAFAAPFGEAPGTSPRHVRTGSRSNSKLTETCHSGFGDRLDDLGSDVAVQESESAFSKWLVMAFLEPQTAF